MTGLDLTAMKGGRLAALLPRITAELKGNPRARLGLLAIGVIAAVYVVFQLDDQIGFERAAYFDNARRLERTAALAQEREWPARAKESAAARAILEAKLWRADSEGLALANFQDWVTSAGRQAGLDKLQVQVAWSRPKGMPPGIGQLSATVTAIETEAALIGFLDRIARDPHLLVMERLQVEERPARALEMTLDAYARIDAAGPAAK
jgi:hypothetical protein